MAKAKSKNLSPKQKAFLAAYRSLGMIKQAAKEAGCHFTAHYKWLQATSDSGDAYRTAFHEAHEEVKAALESEAVRRAIHGTDEPVYYKGKVCGQIRKYSDTLMIVLLKANFGDKYREKQSIEHSGQMQGGELKVVIDGNWYGNASRLSAFANGSPVAGVAVACPPENHHLRPAVGKNGNGSNGNGHRPWFPPGGNAGRN